MDEAMPPEARVVSAPKRCRVTREHESARVDFPISALAVTVEADGATGYRVQCRDVVLRSDLERVRLLSVGSGFRRRPRLLDLGWSVSTAPGEQWIAIEGESHIDSYAIGRARLEFVSSIQGVLIRRGGFLVGWLNHGRKLVDAGGLDPEAAVVVVAAILGDDVDDMGGVLAFLIAQVARLTISTREAVAAALAVDGRYAPTAIAKRRWLVRRRASSSGDGKPRG